jgi:predicted nucleotidyltransferase component of viral defense system
MNDFVALKPERQRLLCEQASERLGLPAASVEKDVWVCWTLREMFGLPGWGEHLTFKGGTSLSIRRAGAGGGAHLLGEGHAAA